MADLSKITLPSGTTYNIKDAEARELIASLSNYTSFLGVTTTALTDGATTNPIKINNADVTAKSGSIATYGSKEFIFNGTTWAEFGDLSGLGSLAYKNSASGSYTPAGSVSQPTFTGTQGNVSVSGTATISTGTGTANYTPAGSVTVDSYTPSGSVTVASYTPAGSVSKPTITVTPTTASVTPIASVGSLPSLTTTVSDETLTIGFSQGSLPTKGTAVTVMTGASATSSQPTFTGTAKAPTATFSGTAKAPTASFSGTGVELKGSVSASGSFMPSGTVSKPAFTGTAKTVTVS